MATYKYDATTNTYVLVDDSTLLNTDPPSTTNSSCTTDTPDYAPGSTAYFTANVGVGDAVTFNVTDVAGTAVSGTNAPWTITDGGVGDLDGLANGVIQTSWSVGLDAAGESFVLSATDQTIGMMATTGFTDSTPIPAVPVTANGTLFATADQGSSTGTGIFPSFVQIQGDSHDTDGDASTEEGFNTNFRPSVLDTQNPLVHNHAIQVQDIPTETAGGITYFVFRLDLNEPNDGQNGQITLDSLKLYASNVANLSTLSGATLLYDMDGNGDQTVSLTDWSSGSGHGDYIVKIPVSSFSSLHATDYIYLYSAFSNASSGFEEWSVATTDNPPPPVPTTSIAGEKYEDVNANGVLDGTDAPKAGFTIDLYEDNGSVAGQLDAGDTLLAQSVTDASGGYEFANVLAGNYIIVEENQTGWFETPDTHTTLVNSAGGTWSKYGYALTVTGLEASGITGKDFANNQGASLSGHKYEDLNGNGVLNPGESGLAGWTIKLFKDGVDTGLTAVTDATGSYTFAHLAAGNYSTQEVMQTDWVQTAGSTPETLTLGENDTVGNDFLNYKEASLSGYKYSDLNDNGVKDPTEPGLAGWTILLTGTDGLGNAVSLTTTTDANGHYEFDHLAPGTYSTQEVMQTGWVQTAGSTPETLISGENDTTGNDFLNYFFVEGRHGLTQGFWSQHPDTWNDTQDTVWANIVDKTDGVWGDAFSAAGVKIGISSSGGAKKIVYTSDSNDDIIWALSHNGGTGTDPGGILLGDANGNGQTDALNGEVTSLRTISQVKTDLAASSLGDAKVIMLNQLDAAQLNIYNGDNDPGSYHLDSKAGHDLVGEGVMWLAGAFSGTPGKTSDPSWTAQIV